MISPALPVGELLDEFVEQLPDPQTVDRRIDRTARIVAATVTTVQAAMDAPLEALRAEVRGRHAGHTAVVLPEPDLHVTCGTALFCRILDILSDAAALMVHGRYASTWPLLTAAAEDLQTLTRLVTSPLPEPGTALAVDSYRARSRRSDHAAQVLGLRSIQTPPSPAHTIRSDDRCGSGRSAVDRVIRSVIEGAAASAHMLPAHAFDLDVFLDRIDYGHKEPSIVAQACLTFDMLIHSTAVLCAHLSELYCADQWTAVGDEIIDPVGDMRNRVWSHPDSACL